MSALHMVELRPDLKALMWFLHGQGLSSLREGDEDLGYGVHAWLAAAFGELAPKPWRILLDRRRPPRILGYAQHNADDLRQWANDFSDPAAFKVCPPEAIASRPMPNLRPERQFSFELQCCPVGRKAGSGIEKDLFLIRADATANKELKRDTIYCDWVRQRLERNLAATVTSVRLASFRLIRQTRQVQGAPGQRSRTHQVRPQALLQGELRVANPDAFLELLARGVGRHRTFGYGMLLLKPPS